MTSRPGPGIHESLQSRGSGVPPRTQVRRRPSKPATTLIQPDCIDPTLEDERPPIHNGANDATRPPPRGRPQLFFSAVPSSGIELPIHSFPYQPTANLPAPPRPGSVHLRDALQQQRIIPGGIGVKDPPKLNAPEVPPPPVHFPGGQAADLFPWTGNSSEDTLSEALVKVGISNKSQIMNETNTARPSLWSNLKNKSGISTLSTLFVVVLEKRQQSGRLQTPNTFKPPPRLTLRDSTREQWLHDLANPTISLRRLSRTIPHGLTGKVLLEQCLNKNIPLPRALWLAKCVGINELRAHKRKGQAGTVTWGRGWTSSVEQFLDGVIGTIGQGDWKPRITYALQLATCLYKEHLLDEDHFLDWIINGLNTCPCEHLFVWLLVVSVSHYWMDITCCRRRGKRLAESLLNQLDKIYRLEDQNTYSAVLQYLENIVVKLLATRPACLLLPSTWARHSAPLEILTERRNHPQVTQAVKRLQERNNRLLQTTKNKTVVSHTRAGQVYCILDSVNYNSAVRIEELSYECIEVISDGTQLIAVLLQWACSYYRRGPHRTFLATRLLRKWSQLGADIYEGVISYLRNMSWIGNGDPNIIFKIVGELVRSKTFAAGRYLQWLIATGSLVHDTDLPSPTSWPLRLITEIPLSGLSDQIRTLRSTLLRGTPHATELEQQVLEHAQDMISQSLPILFGLYNISSTLPKVDVEKLNSTVRLELGIWLRKQVAQFAEVNEHVPTKDPSIEETAAVSLITASEFHVVRSWLERFGDLAILADVVNITCSSLDPSVLASAADTITFHMKTFRAIGAFDPLFGRIATRYASIRTIRFPERELLLSLSNLARVAQTDGHLQQLLSYDLSRLDQRNSIAACSPASDNMGEVMQYIGSYSDDEIERILSSGNSMDQQMMARVLRKIISNQEVHVAKGQLDSDNYPTWFHRLRSFDEPTFELVVNEWLDACFKGHQLDVLKIALPTLVGCGCMALSSVLDTWRVYVTQLKVNPSERVFQSALESLHVLLPVVRLTGGCSPPDAYRYRLEQHKLCQETGRRIAHCICEVFELGSTILSSTIRKQLSSLASKESVLDIMRHYVVSDPGCLSKLSREASGPYLKQLLDTLLDPVDRLHLVEQTPEQQVLTVFETASELSLPICQAIIEHIFASGTAMSGDSADALSAALLSAIKRAVEEGQSVGLELLATLDSNLTDKIRQHAEREIISASAFFASPPGIKTEETEHTSAALVQKYLTVIDLTSSNRTETNEQAAMLIALIERFKGIAQALTDPSTLFTHPGQANNLSVPELYAWLNALLRLAVTHCETLLRTATHTHQTAFMVTMIALVSHPALEFYTSISEHIFDVAVTLSDYISDDVRSHVSRLDSVKSTDDPRCLFILGATAPVDGWLVLTKPINPTLNQPSSQPPTPGSIQTQPSPYQSPQMSTTGPATPQQRYFNQQQQQRHQQQQQMQAQQAQQMRNYSSHNQYSLQQNKMLPAQLQRTPSNQASPSPLQQMQHMQQMQGLAQQRATQPSPVYSQQRAGPTPAASQTSSSGSQMSSGTGGGGVAPGKLQLQQSRQEKEMRQYPFVQPRWEILAESSGNPNANETAISLSLFGARKV